MYITNNVGPKTDPCGRLLETLCDCDGTPFTNTCFTNTSITAKVFDPVCNLEKKI